MESRNDLRRDGHDKRALFIRQRIDRAQGGAFTILDVPSLSPRAAFLDISEITGSGPMNRPFSDSDLLAYSSEHVWYEVWMFFHMATILSLDGGSSQASTTSETVTGLNYRLPTLFGTRDVPPQVLRNSQIESFMTHLRNLIDFLFDLESRDTDVVALDFCFQGSWKPMPTATLKSAKVRVNKELAHLTTARISGDPASRHWDVIDLANELRPVLTEFTSKADPAKLSPRVKTAIR